MPWARLNLFSRQPAGGKWRGDKRRVGPCPLLQPAGQPVPLFSFRRQKEDVMGGVKDIMMALNVVKEQHGVGRLRAAKAGARRGLVVTAGGSGRAGHKDRAKPLTLGICRVGVFLWVCPVALMGGIQGGDRAPSRVPTHGPWGSHTTPRSRGRSGETPANPEESDGPAAERFCSQALGEGWVSLV